MQVTIKDGIITNRAPDTIEIREPGSVVINITDKDIIQKLQSGDLEENEFEYKDGSPIRIKTLK